MYRLLSPKKRPDREVEACCILSKDVDTPGPKNLVRALEDYKLEQDQSFEDWVKTILILLAPNMVESTVLIEGNPIGDGGEGLLAGGGKTYETTPSHIAAGRREPHTPQEQKCTKNKCPNQRSRDESDLTEEKQGTSKRTGK
ncbi:hypothetical protein FocTR4_00010489 [Fusarium oxysporum f. sp. cubense]|uniref:Uncharacterized protein n=1 Tax=Fusarium oxysporum f. sp. cubense TaxID=61366 RepID=A0A5C6T6Y4_FUSOC|nr:hypothetical protein FocTR4_00010489 [Fusarium oxysporum f. sp. cubense]